jgi:hypothetical protein
MAIEDLLGTLYGILCMTVSQFHGSHLAAGEEMVSINGDVPSRTTTSAPCTAYG